MGPSLGTAGIRAFFVLLLACVPAQGQEVVAERVCEFSRYAGYSEPIYDAWRRESFYISMRDGVRLACDLYRPTRGGRLHSEPLPLVWTHHRYHRASNRQGQVSTLIAGRPGLAELSHHGYLVAAVDVRGAGASFGTWTGIFNELETRDAYEIIEWFAAQSWCDGNIGMYGGSYLGGTQFMAAGENNPHLKAIFPVVALLDQYDCLWGGGIFRDDLCRYWGELTRMLDRSTTIAPVLSPQGTALRDQALAEHEGNLHFENSVMAMPFRDSTPPEGYVDYLTGSPLERTAKVRASGVAVYHQGGWFDTFPRDAFLMYRNLNNPQKMVIGPWFHSQSDGVDWGAEYLRWFDHWLKGIDNGVMDEPPIHYYLMGAPKDEAWKSASQWPLAEERRVPYFLGEGPSGSIDSVNDGLLLAGSRPEQEGTDEYLIDPQTSVGPLNRWTVAVGQGGGNPAYRDQQHNDRLCLTYTTPPLNTGLEVTGHGIAHLWIESLEEDVDVFLYLEEVLPDGTSEYVTEGCLRASHRVLTEPDHERFGLPYHRSFAEDSAPLPEEVVELVIDLQPTSNWFDQGHRLRFTIAGADHETCETPIHDPAAELFVVRTAAHPSRLVLPIIPRHESTAQK